MGLSGGLARWIVAPMAVGMEFIGHSLGGHLCWCVLGRSQEGRTRTNNFGPNGVGVLGVLGLLVCGSLVCGSLGLLVCAVCLPARANNFGPNGR